MPRLLAEQFGCALPIGQLQKPQTMWSVERKRSACVRALGACICVAAQSRAADLLRRCPGPITLSCTNTLIQGANLFERMVTALVRIAQGSLSHEPGAAALAPLEEQAIRYEVGCSLGSAWRHGDNCSNCPMACPGARSDIVRSAFS